MRIKLIKNDFDRNFVYYYLPKFMYSILNNELIYNRSSIHRLDSLLNIDCQEIMLSSFRRLDISYDNDYYYIKINQIDLPLIREITYGNLSCRGYDLVMKIFQLVSDKKYTIYSEWKGNYGY